MAYKPGQDDEGKEGGNQQPTSTSLFRNEGMFNKLQAEPSKVQKTGDKLFTLVDNAQERSTFRVPTGLYFRWIPTFGIANDVQDPINQAFLNVLNKMKSALRQRTLPYQQNDVAVVLSALDNVHIMYDTIVRNAKLAQSTSITNAGVGLATLASLGLNASDWNESLTQIEKDTAYWKETMDSWPMPKLFKCFAIHQQMSKCLFYDTDSTTAQFYIMYPDGVWDYGDTDKAERLAYRSLNPAGGAAGTYASYKVIMNDLINHINNSTSAKNIIADVLSSFPKAERIEIEPFKLGETVDAEYDTAFLAALHNAHVYDVDIADIAPAVDASGNIFTSAKVVVRDGVLPHSIYDTVNPALTTANDMVDNSRFRIVTDGIVQDGYSNVIAMGTEVLVSMGFIHPVRYRTNPSTGAVTTEYLPDGQATLKSDNTVHGYYYANGEFDTYLGLMAAHNGSDSLNVTVLTGLTQCAWAPITITGSQRSGSDLRTFVPVMCGNYTFTMSDGDVYEYIRSALWSTYVEDLAKLMPERKETN